jgi:glycine hydroxymethyltransferase
LPHRERIDAHHTQCEALAGWICDILDNLGDADVEANVAKNVAALCADYPVYR